MFNLQKVKHCGFREVSTFKFEGLPHESDEIFKVHKNINFQEASMTQLITQAQVVCLNTWNLQQ